MDFSPEQYLKITQWVNNNFIPSKNINYQYSAYTIHGIFHHLYDRGFYIDEDILIKAMSDCGFRVKERDEQFYFNVSSQRFISIPSSSNISAVSRRWVKGSRTSMVVTYQQSHT